MTRPIQVLGFSGSLRRASWNTGMLRAAGGMLPEGMSLEIFDIAPIPFYNQDLDTPDTVPEPVQHFKDRLRAADALLIASPEYNYSIPGVLKNAIDWASRPPRGSALHHKPIALIGASPGSFGTARSQLALRQVFLFTRSLVMPEPELYVSAAYEKVDQDGNLQDEETR